MTFIKKMTAGAFAALVFTLALTACGGSSSSAASPTPSAASAITAAKFEALLLESPAMQKLEASNAALTTKVKRLPIGELPQTTDAASTNAVTLAVTPNFGTCTDEGLLFGTASGTVPALGHVATRITCMLYEYSYSTLDGTIAPLPGMEWDGANCSGKVYATQAVTPQLALNGYVFSMPGQADNSAVKAGQPLQTVQVFSQSDSTGNCIDNSGSPFSDDVYGIIPNDPMVTGVPNSSVPVNIKNGSN